MAVRSSVSSLGLYRRSGRSPFSLVSGTDSVDLSQTSVVNNELKVIRTNEKEQLQVGDVDRCVLLEVFV